MSSEAQPTISSVHPQDTPLSQSNHVELHSPLAFPDSEVKKTQEEVERDLRLWNMAYNSLINLSHEDGFNASSASGAYGRPFGRDLSITALSVESAHEAYPIPELVDISGKSLRTLMQHQGKENNPDASERKGKAVHEVGFTGVDHLTNPTNGMKPWHVSPDGIMRNYDSLDSTPLLLLAQLKHFQVTKDTKFLSDALPSAEAALTWILTSADIDNDGLVEYDSIAERKYGGLIVQNWTDSHESIRQADGNLPVYPIAPVEVQGITWRALREWSDFLQGENIDEKAEYIELAREARAFADRLKQRFNETFIIEDKGLNYAAQALDGDKRPIRTITVNPLLLAWASYQNPKTGFIDSIVNYKDRADFVKRGMQSDLFHPKGGIRTMSTESPTFNGGRDSYHNGSIWPFTNGMVSKGLEYWGFESEAKKVADATLSAIDHIGSPVELFTIDTDQNIQLYREASGQEGCRDQAWTGGALLEMLAPRHKRPLGATVFDRAAAD